MPNEDLISSFVNEAPGFDTNQFGYSGDPNEFDPSADFSDVSMEASSPFPPIDNNFTAQDQYASSGMMMDDSTSNDTTGQTWDAQPAYVPPQIDTSSQYNDSITGTNSFHQTPINDMMAMQPFEDVSPLHTRNFSVPEIVLQDSTDTGLMQPQAPQVLYRISSQDEEVYADIFQEIEKFASTVYDAAMSTAMPSTSQSLSSMIEYERMSQALYTITVILTYLHRIVTAWQHDSDTQQLPQLAAKGVPKHSPTVSAFETTQRFSRARARLCEEPCPPIVPSDICQLAVSNVKSAAAALWSFLRLCSQVTCDSFELRRSPSKAILIFAHALTNFDISPTAAQ